MRREPAWFNFNHNTSSNASMNERGERCEKILNSSTPFDEGNFGIVALVSARRAAFEPPQGHLHSSAVIAPCPAPSSCHPPSDLPLEVCRSEPDIEGLLRAICDLQRHTRLYSAGNSQRISNARFNAGSHQFRPVGGQMRHIPKERVAVGDQLTGLLSAEQIVRMHHLHRWR